MTSSLIALLAFTKKIWRDDDLVLSTCLEHDVPLYVEVPSGFAVTTSIFPRHRSESTLCSEVVLSNCRYLRLSATHIATIQRDGVAHIANFHRGVLLDTEVGLAPSNPELVRLTDERSTVQVHWPVANDDLYQSQDLGVVADALYQLAPPHVVPDALYYSVNVYASGLFLTPHDAARLEKILLKEAQRVDPWNHRQRAPAVFLIYKAAYHFWLAPYSFNHALEWIEDNDKQGLFTGKSKARDYAAHLINRHPKHRSVDSNLKTDLIAKNELGRDYSEDFCSKRLSLLLLATDVWLLCQEHPTQGPLLEGGLQGYLAALGFPSFDENKLKKKRELDGRDPKAIATSRLENPCAYLESIIRTKFSET